MSVSPVPVSRRPRPSGGPGGTSLFADEGTVQGWLLRHALVVDVVLAAALGGASVLTDAFSSDYRSHGAEGWDLLVCAPLVLRRRHPRAAAVLVGAVCLIEWAVDVRAVGTVAVLVILYSLGAYERRRRVLAVAVVVAELGVVLAVTRFAAPSNQVIGVATATGTVTASWVAGIYMSMRRAYVASIRERAETAERERDSRAQVAVAAERARMAREMHDVIAHSLSVMITLNDAAAAVEVSPGARATMAQASDVGRQALDEMHRMLAVLRDGEAVDYAPQPGLGELPDLVAMVRSAGLAVELSVSGDLADVPPTAQLALYRIVQESLTNILKHARNVERVSITVVRREGRLDLRVRDDGAVADAVDALPGHGLSGMAERARLFGGHLTAGPGPGGGWLVDARLDVGPPRGRGR